MGRGSHYESVPRFCLSTEDYRKQCELRDYYNERRNYFNNIIEEKLIPDWFYLPYCDDCENIYIEFVDNVCSNYRSHRTVITCNFC